MPITLQLGMFRGWSEVDRRAVSNAYFKALGSHQSGRVGRILDDIGHAITGSTEPTVPVDVSGATPREMTTVTAFLVSFGQIAPKETPPDWVRQFIRDAEAADPLLLKQRRMDGFPPA